MDFKDIKTRIIIVLILSVIFLLSYSYLGGSLWPDSVLFRITDLIFFVVCGVLLLHMLDRLCIQKNIKKNGAILLTILFIHIGVTVFLEKWQIYNTVRAETISYEGYFVMPAKKRCFYCYGNIGWGYDLIVDGRKKDSQYCSWLPDSDTILVGVCKSGSIIDHFILDKHPSSEQIRKAKDGWYVYHNKETIIPIYYHAKFHKKLLNLDKLREEDIKKNLHSDYR